MTDERVGQDPNMVRNTEMESVINDINFRSHRGALSGMHVSSKGL